MHSKRGVPDFQLSDVAVSHTPLILSLKSSCKRTDIYGNVSMYMTLNQLFSGSSELFFVVTSYHYVDTSTLYRLYYTVLRDDKISA